MNYTALANRTNKLITKFGTVGVLKHFTMGTFLASQGIYTSSSSAVYNINLVDVTPTKTNLKGYGETYIGGTLILQNDRIVLFTTNATSDPELGDRLTLNSKVYGIVGISVLEPSSTVLFYRGLLRE